MIGLDKLGMFVVCIVLLAPPGAAQSLARYRDFEFGMTVDSVAKQTQSGSAGPKTVYTMPDLIQTLQWNRQAYFSGSTPTDPVRSMRFDFYNNQLFRIVSVYGGLQLEGMKADDLIEAISKVYGASSRPDESIIVSAYLGYEDRQKVVARWEDDEHEYSLFRSSFGGEFGLVAYSKTLGAMVARSIQEAERLEAVAAPQREIDRRQKEARDRQLAEEKARSVNRPNFRP